MSRDLERCGLIAAILVVGCSAPPPDDMGDGYARTPLASRLASAEVENMDYDSGPRGPVAPSTGTVERGEPAAVKTGATEPSKDGVATSKAGDKKSPVRPQIIGQIVRGTPAPGRSIGIVDIERCFDLIPSYRKVHAERSSKEYARYLLLLSQANDEFRQAVDWIALRDGVDVVVEKGGVVGARTIDITNEVCERLREQQGEYTR